MKKTITLFAVIAGSLLMMNCSSGKSSAGTTPAMSAESKVAAVKKNFSAQQLEEGKTLWQGNCDRCHKLFTPDSRDVEKWERVLPRMIKRSKLTDMQGQMVRAYLLTNAKAS